MLFCVSAITLAFCPGSPFWTTVRAHYYCSFCDPVSVSKLVTGSACSFKSNYLFNSHHPRNKPSLYQSIIKLKNDILQSQKRTVITSFYNKPTSMTVMQISGNAVTLMTVKSSQVPNRFSSLDRTLDRQNRTDAGCTFPPAPNSRRKGLFT